MRKQEATTEALRVPWRRQDRHEWHVRGVSASNSTTTRQKTIVGIHNSEYSVKVSSHRHRRKGDRRCNQNEHARMLRSPEARQWRASQPW